jgi:hypothetical protein
VAASKRGWLAVTLACYAVLTWVFCAALLDHRGLYGETTWVELSQTRSWWQGFFYPYDSSRRLLPVTNQIAYLLSDGSYSSLNAIYGLTILTTGLLTFAIVGALMPEVPFVAFVAGAIALTHGADRLTNFLPIVQVRQGVVASLAAVLLLIVGVRRSRPWLLLPAALAQVLSLWTYEAALPALLCAPMLTWPLHGRRRSWIGWSVIWEVVPVAAAILLVVRYTTNGITTYQSTKFMADASLWRMVRNVGWMAVDGLGFWKWPGDWLESMAAACRGDLVQRMFVPLALGGAAMVAASAWAARTSASSTVPQTTVLRRVLIATVFLVLCYLAFAPLRDAWFTGRPWRTQFYSAVPAAVLLSIGIGWLHARSLTMAVAASTIVVMCGLASGLAAQVEDQTRWREYQRVMRAIVGAAPRLEQESMVVLVNVPSEGFRSVCAGTSPFDPFSGDQMWFNSGLQVLYPGTRLVGLYWTPERISPGAIQYAFDKDGAHLERTSITVKGDRFRYDQMLAFSFDRERGAVLMDRFPSDRIPDSVASRDYYPRARIQSGPPPLETVRKLQE